VFGIRRERDESWLLQSMRRFFYWLVNALSADDLPRDAGDFRLIDRRIIDELKRIRDPNIYVRGRISALGFRQVGVPYNRAARQRGKSKFNFSRMLTLAIDAITSHSVLPLRFASLCGAAALLIAPLMIAGYSIAHFMVGTEWPPGFTTLTVLITFAIGINGMLFGILGEYIARIYQHLKIPPYVIIETAVSDEAEKEIASDGAANPNR
jgi:dolichol-phosphate mannosyltransferase